MNSQIKGILFDMDGVLVDSEKFICEAAIQMFAEHGVNAKPEDFLPFVGAGENRYIGGVAEKYGLGLNLEKEKARVYSIYAEITKGKLHPLKGVTDFIKTCRNKGLKLAVATSADRVKMLVNLKEIGLPETTFDATIDGTEVMNKKPHPEIFLKAAEKLDLKPEECLVIEDAVNGIKAGKAAGCKCLALTSSFPKAALKEADWIVKDLSEVPDELISKFKDS